MVLEPGPSAPEKTLDQIRAERYERDKDLARKRYWRNRDARLKQIHDKRAAEKAAGKKKGSK